MNRRFVDWDTTSAVVYDQCIFNCRAHGEDEKIVQATTCFQTINYICLYKVLSFRQMWSKNHSTV